MGPTCSGEARPEHGAGRERTSLGPLEWGESTREAAPGRRPVLVNGRGTHLRPRPRRPSSIGRTKLWQSMTHHSMVGYSCRSRQGPSARGWRR